MALKDFDRRLVTLIAEAMEAAENKEEHGEVCYRVTRTACYLHAQEFGPDNGRRLINRVIEKIFDDLESQDKTRPLNKTSNPTTQPSTGPRPPRRQ